MRPDLLTPRTVLLAAIAGWSVLVALLALFGLGGYITPLKDDPALVTPLPQLGARPVERLGVPSQYTAATARPLFYPSRTPQPFYLSGEMEAGDQGFDYVLSSVLITPGLRMAILQPSQGGEGIRVKEDEAPAPNPQWRLVELAERSAVFEGPEGRRTLELRVFDGQGGQPPSAAIPAAGMDPGMPAPASQSPRTTGGSSMPSPIKPPVPTPAPVPAPTADEPVQTTAEQMDAIRQRIEERRRRMREQQPGNPPAATPDKTQ